MRDARLQTILRVLLIAALLVSALTLSGCDGWFPGMSLESLLTELFGDWDEDDWDEEAETFELVEIALTHPAGASPNVFTTGWVFGARATVTDEDGNTRDISNKVRWSGSGSFSPAQGNQSRPAFSGTGANQIKLSVEVGGEMYEKQFSVSCVSPAGYAAVGDLSQEQGGHGHGCPACPHPSPTGPITTGSPNVFVGGRPAARVGDQGVAASCCGPNRFEISGGDGSVLINGRAAAKIGSPTDHCYGAGTGQIIGGGG